MKANYVKLEFKDSMKTPISHPRKRRHQRGEDSAKL